MNNTENITTSKKDGRLKRLLKSRKAKKGTLAVAILAVFIAIIVLVNFIAHILVERFPNLQFDMTASQTYQLQKDTKDYITQLDKDITIYVLATENTFKSGMNAYSGSQYFVQADKLLHKMAASSDHVKLEFIDLSANPTFTGKYKNVDWNSQDAGNLIIVDAGEKYTALTLKDCFTYDEETYSYYGYYSYTATSIEQAVVTGILDVTIANKVGVDFITGSGEEEELYSSMKNLLKQNAYEVREVNLTTKNLNESSQIAVLFAPTVDLSEKAVDKLESWLENDGEKGKTLIYLPIDVKTETPNLDALLKQYGMEVSDGLCFCTNNNYYLQNVYMFLAEYNNDSYTSELKNASIPTIVYNSRNIILKDGSKAQSLLNLTKSVGVLPFDTDTSKFESDKDLEKFMTADGVNLAAIGSKTNADDKGSKIAVFGSPYMFAQTFLGTTSYNNANYLVNFCNTVSNREDMGVTINSAAVDGGELGVTNSSTTVAVGLIFIVLIPLGVLIIGLILYIRRRNK